MLKNNASFGFLLGFDFLLSDFFGVWNLDLSPGAGVKFSLDAFLLLLGVFFSCFTGVSTFEGVLLDMLLGVFFIVSFSVFLTWLLERGVLGTGILQNV